MEHYSITDAAVIYASHEPLRSWAEKHGGAIIHGVTYFHYPDRGGILVREDWAPLYQSMAWEEFLAAVRNANKNQNPN